MKQSALADPALLKTQFTVCRDAFSRSLAENGPVESLVVRYPKDMKKRIGFGSNPKRSPDYERQIIGGREVFWQAIGGALRDESFVTQFEIFTYQKVSFNPNIPFAFGVACDQAWGLLATLDFDAAAEFRHQANPLGADIHVDLERWRWVHAIYVLARRGIRGLRASLRRWAIDLEDPKFWDSYRSDDEREESLADWRRERPFVVAHDVLENVQQASIDLFILLENQATMLAPPLAGQTAKPKRNPPAKKPGRKKLTDHDPKYQAYLRIDAARKEHGPKRAVEVIKADKDLADLLKQANLKVTPGIVKNASSFLRKRLIRAQQEAQRKQMPVS